MKSVRLSPQTENRLERAARSSGVSESEFIREAIERRCDEVLGDSLAERLADVIGIVDSEGGRARTTGDSFTRILRAKKAAS